MQTHPVLPGTDHLVRYAWFAYADNDGADFRNLATDLQGTPISARRVQSTRFTRTHVYLGIRNTNTLVLAFRGTDLPMKLDDAQRIDRFLGLSRNALIDISYSFISLDWPDLSRVLVHEGFLLAFNVLTANMMLKITTLLRGNEPRRIEVCGHSLGGALATLCALWCRLQWAHADITCVTLGSPRVGNQGFANEFNGRNIKCYRLIYGSDPVANLPNKTIEKLPLRYSTTSVFGVTFRGGDAGQTWAHVGQQIDLPGVAPDNWLQWGLRAITFAAADHYPTRYTGAVRRVVERMEEQRQREDEQHQREDELRRREEELRR
ncbi:lipase precursor [Fusarium mundagurra]|uniref:Lipase n=1 Tax=Fusarium mundagurra TaxID=1567541 RepID=A0A8H5XJQ4_9HYPO|nr:lipase precursor [Fusarium mundagurra]